MSMLLLESDKSTVGMFGLQGGIMLDERRISERAGEQANPVKETGVRREMGRRSAPADQLMYAWSMSATRPNPEKVTQTVRIIVEECPPEVYLG